MLRVGGGGGGGGGAQVVQVKMAESQRLNPASNRLTLNFNIFKTFKEHVVET